MKRLVKGLKNTVMAAGVLGLGLVATTGTANANFGDVKFYAGAGVSYGTYGIDKKYSQDLATGGFKIKSKKGAGFLIPVLGVKFHDNFAVEAGYSLNHKIKLEDSKGVKSSPVKGHNAYIDLIGTMPVANQFDVVGGLGVGKLMAKLSQDEKDSGSKAKNKFGFRAKVGAQYNCTSNVAFRAMLAYQQAGNKIKEDDTEYKLIKNMKSIEISAIYTFC